MIGVAPSPVRSNAHRMVAAVSWPGTADPFFVVMGSLVGNFVTRRLLREPLFFEFHLECLDI